MEKSAIDAIKTIDNDTILSYPEKQALNDVKPDDYTKLKTQIDNLPLSNGEKVKDFLHEVSNGNKSLDNLNSSEDKGKIQLAAIANGVNIKGNSKWTLGIDGAIGGGAKAGINSIISNYKDISNGNDTDSRDLPDDFTEYDPNEDTERNESEVYNRAQLMNANMIDKLEDFRDAKYNLLCDDENSENYGRLKKVEAGDGQYSLIVYYGPSSSQSIIIEDIRDFTITKEGKKPRLSVKKFKDTIIAKIKEQESQTNREANEKRKKNMIKNGIENFTVENFKDPVIKHYFQNKGLFFRDIKITRGEKGEVVNFFDGEVGHEMKTNQLYTVAGFNTGKMGDLLSKGYLNKAISYTQEEFKQRIQEFPDILNIDTLDTVKYYQQECETAIQDIRNICGEGPFQLIRNEFTDQYNQLYKIGEQLKTQEKYLTQKDQLTQTIGNISDIFEETNGRTNDSTKARQIIEQLKTIGIQAFQGDPNHPQDITINNSNYIKYDFQQAQKGDEYLQYIKNIQEQAANQDYSNIRILTVND